MRKITLIQRYFPTWAISWKFWLRPGRIHASCTATRGSQPAKLSRKWNKIYWPLCSSVAATFDYRSWLLFRGLARLHRKPASGFVTRYFDNEMPKRTYEPNHDTWNFRCAWKKCGETLDSIWKIAWNSIFWNLCSSSI